MIYHVAYDLHSFISQKYAQGRTLLVLGDEARGVVPNALSITDFLDCHATAPKPLVSAEEKDTVLTKKIREHVDFPYNDVAMLRDIGRLLAGKIENSERAFQALSGAMSRKEHAMYRICYEWYLWLDEAELLDTRDYYGNKAESIAQELLANKTFVMHTECAFRVERLLELAHCSESWDCVFATI